jgi:hypothetical protein
MGAIASTKPSERAAYAGGEREGVSVAGGSVRTRAAVGAVEDDATAAAAIGALLPAAIARVAFGEDCPNLSTHHCDAGNETDPLSDGIIHTDREQFAAIFDCRAYCR